MNILGTIVHQDLLPFECFLHGGSLRILAMHDFPVSVTLVPLWGLGTK